MELSAFVALDRNRSHAHSAMPDAPVVEPSKSGAPKKVRRGAAGVLRKAADRLEPAAR